jgi:NAD-dependent dihydropyrimidine dehydrogenase PreA subunit
MSGSSGSTPGSTGVAASSPDTAKKAATREGDDGCVRRNVALPVLGVGGGGGRGEGGGGPKVHRKVRMGRRRAIVLILVHVVILLHVAQWLLSGMSDGIRETLSPVEPSESMYTLEGGYVNAGFIFFVTAIVSTLIFGRFFCGWGCHVVALQDWCAHLMKKAGIHPKPFRARLLLWAPLLLAVYMFVWPTVKRLAFDFALPSLGVTRADWPSWLPMVPQFNEFTSHLIVEDFWRTFPPWYVAIPFLFVCGFAVVYFLGSKGFCTYGCPYGGFFGPADLVSPGKIKVNNDCNGCGHCTAVCTSNVRVHQEVRDYGVVVDPGCMKCLDCVSVCPNDALSFGFAKPTIFNKGRTEAARKKKTQRPPYDLTWREEAWVAILALVLFMSFRGMFNAVPMLMAVGMALIAAFSAWKLRRMFTTPNVRLQAMQLVYRGSWTRAGYAFALFTVVMLAMGAWSGVVRGGFVLGNYYDAQVTIGADVVFARGYTPPADQKALALAAIEHFERGGAWSDGGIGWDQARDRPGRLAWLHAVAGDYAASERYMKMAMTRNVPDQFAVEYLARIIALQGRPEAEIDAALEEVLAANPRAHAVALTLARVANQRRKFDEAFERAKKVAFLHRPAPPGQTAQALNIMLTSAGNDKAKRDEVVARARFEVERRPEVGQLHFALALALYAAEDKAGALAAMREAVARDRLNLRLHQSLLELTAEVEGSEAAGKVAEAMAEVERELEALQAAGQLPVDTTGAEPPQGSQARP